MEIPQSMVKSIVFRLLKLIVETYSTTVHLHISSLKLFNTFNTGPRL